MPDRRSVRFFYSGKAAAARIRPTMETTELQTDTSQLPEDALSAKPFAPGLSGGWRRELLFWTLHTLFWAGLGGAAYCAIQVYRPDLAGTGQSVFQQMLAGFALTAALRWCYHLPGIRQGHGPLPWLFAAGCSLAVCLLDPLLFQGIQLTAPSPLASFMTAAAYRLFALRLSVILVWNALYFMFHLLEERQRLQLRAVQAEAARRRSELRHLQAQLNPHFLFNALNTILASKDDAHAVEEITQSLADFLRLSLQETRLLEPLGRELGMIEKYLTVQHSRFGPNLACQIECDTAARAVPVPPMLIQPLLENAFNHGPKTGTLPLHVKVTVRSQPEGLHVTVANSGTWIPPRSQATPGTGIASLRQRLHLLLGDEARLTHEAGGGWVRAHIFIPVSDRNGIRTTENPHEPSPPQLSQPQP